MDPVDPVVSRVVPAAPRILVAVLLVRPDLVERRRILPGLVIAFAQLLDRTLRLDAPASVRIGDQVTVISFIRIARERAAPGLVITTADQFNVATGICSVAGFRVGADECG